MARTITMPRFGATMEEGTINSWLVKEGDAVSKGDVLGEIAIEKLSNELLAESDGVVLKIIAEVGVTVLCGEPILIMGAVGESLADSVEAAPIKAEIEPVSVPPVVSQPKQVVVSQSAEFSASVQITPKALQLAEELGVDYHYVKGSGRFGMITREDLRAAIAAGTAPKLVAAAPVVQAVPAPSVPPSDVHGETRKMSQMQQTIARAMDNSLKSTAQTTISMDMDASQLAKVYRAYKDLYSQKGIKLTYTTLLVKIVALALVEHPVLRTFIDDSSLVTRSEINVGIAIDIPDGLVVANIKNADKKTIRQIASELVDLGSRAKNGTLTLDEVTAGTFTITNLGMFGVKYFTPVLNPGESGILGVGMIQDVATIQDGGLFIKPVMNLSLTHDHRVVNGAPAARFLQTIQQLMNDSEKLFWVREIDHD